MGGAAARAAGARASIAAFALLLAGCATDRQLHDAISAVNTEFQRRYERILATDGTREVGVGRVEAFDAIRAALVGLETRIESEDRELGYLNVYAPAPMPLSAAEWQRAVAADLPLMREIVRPYVGILAEFIAFEPDAFEIVINVTIVPHEPRSAVALTMRMREVKQSRPASFPRREYAPPTAVRMGLAKIWSALERELGRLPRRSGGAADPRPGPAPQACLSDAYTACVSAAGIALSRAASTVRSRS